MGYTHYYEHPNKPLPTKQWDAFIKDVHKIFATHADIICEESDEPALRPIADSDMVFFNGRERDGHETFVFKREPAQVPWRKGQEDIFAFCKTARKPYDEVVVAVMSCMRHHFDRVKISSDGGPEAFPAYDDLVTRYNLDPTPIPA